MGQSQRRGAARRAKEPGELVKYEHEVIRRRGAKPQTETYRGRDGVIQVPAELEPIVVGVFGLDNRRVTQHNSADPPNTVPLSVKKITELYEFPKNSAAGQTIGIFSEGGYLASDISLTFSGHPPSVTDVPVDANNGGFADPRWVEDREALTTRHTSSTRAAIPGFSRWGARPSGTSMGARVTNMCGMTRVRLIRLTGEPREVA